MIFWLLVSSICTASRPSLLLTLPPQGMDSGVCDMLGGDTTGQVTPTNQRYFIPYNAMLSDKREKG